MPPPLPPRTAHRGVALPCARDPGRSLVSPFAASGLYEDFLVTKVRGLEGKAGKPDLTLTVLKTADCAKLPEGWGIEKAGGGGDGD